MLQSVPKLAIWNKALLVLICIKLREEGSKYCNVYCILRMYDLSDLTDNENRHSLIVRVGDNLFSYQEIF